MRIDRVEARSILDTRGKATIETTLFANTFSATASVPSGKSTGAHEALELRDDDGGVTRAINNVNGEIAQALAEHRFDTLDNLDAFLVELDGTPNKSRLGANAILSVSIAAMRLSALLEGIPLWRAVAQRARTKPIAPRLYANVMNGGVHADFKLPFQEYIVVVEGKTSDALPVIRKVFTSLGERLGGGVSFGDEGGYAPAFETIEEPFEILTELIKASPHTSIAIDAAASELFHDDGYVLHGKSYSAHELSNLYQTLVTHFPLRSIEDPFDENAHDDFARLTAALGEKVLIVGDDLTVTNPLRITDAISNKEINTVLIKPNQIGTVGEAISAIQKATAAGFKTIASHRSGETEDTFIADFAYGVGAYGLKAGGLAQKERLLKYDRLLAIEREAEAV
jgi:enolase